MTIAKHFTTLRPFPYHVSTWDNPETTSYDWVGDLTLAQVMGFAWNLQSLSFTTTGRMYGFRELEPEVEDGPRPRAHYFANLTGSIKLGTFQLAGDFTNYDEVWAQKPFVVDTGGFVAAGDVGDPVLPHRRFLCGLFGTTSAVWYALKAPSSLKPGAPNPDDPQPNDVFEIYPYESDGFSFEVQKDPDNAGRYGLKYAFRFGAGFGPSVTEGNLRIGNPSNNQLGPGEFITSGQFQIAGITFDWAAYGVGEPVIDPALSVAATFFDYADGAPGAPTRPQATTTARGKVTVMADGRSSATGYTVYRNSTNSTTGAVPISTGLTAPFYVDETATPGAPVYYFWKATNAHGTSAFSVGVAGWANAVIVAPAAPTISGVTDSPGSTDTLLVTWSPVATTLRYEVWRGPTADPADATFVGYTEDESFEADEADRGTLWFWFIRAWNYGGLSDFSEPGYLDQLPEPGGFVATDGAAGYVDLSWSAVTGARGYRVYREGELIASPSAGTLTYRDESMEYHETYSYTVVAVNFSGDGLSAVDSGSADYPVPAAPTDLVASDGTEISAVALSWSPSDYADTYSVYRKVAGGFDAYALIASGLTETSYVDEVESGETYSYVVRATGESGTSGDSAPDTGYAAGLDAPGDVAATDNDLDEVEITWAAVTGATSYSVYREGVLLASGITDLAYTDDTGTIGAFYTYQVTASNGLDESALSAEAEGRRARIADPATVTASDNFALAIQVSWAGVTDALIYKIYRDGTFLGQVPAPDTGPVVDVSVTDYLPHLYVVVAVRNDNESPGLVSDYGQRLP